MFGLQIIPRAIDYFTGKALEYESMDEDDFEDYDDDDDEDDEDDVRYSDEITAFLERHPLT
jgi:nucleosome assembly protein 1-like 1